MALGSILYVCSCGKVKGKTGEWAFSELKLSDVARKAFRGENKLFVLIKRSQCSECATAQGKAGKIHTEAPAV